MIFMSPNFVVNCNAITKCTLPRGGARFQRFHWIEEVDHPLLPFPLEAKATVQTHQKLSRIISPVASSYLTLLKRPTHCGKSQFFVQKNSKKLKKIVNLNYFPQVKCKKKSAFFFNFHKLEYSVVFQLSDKKLRHDHVY